MKETWGFQAGRPRDEAIKEGPSLKSIVLWGAAAGMNIWEKKVGTGQGKDNKIWTVGNDSGASENTTKKEKRFFGCRGTGGDGGNPRPRKKAWKVESGRNTKKIYSRVSGMTFQGREEGGGNMSKSHSWGQKERRSNISRTTKRAEAPYLRGVDHSERHQRGG